MLVAKLSPNHIARDRQNSGPGNIVAIVIPERGSYIGDTAVRALSLADIAHPLGIETLVVEEERLAQASHSPIAQPRLALVALRTVNRHALVIVDDAPPGILHHLIDNSV